MLTVRVLLAAAFAAASLPAAAAHAQPLNPSLPGYGHRVWTTRDGLPQNLVKAIVQARDGYLWIGTTNGGLVRFDGLTFTVFNVATTPALPSNWIEALYEDANGTLWIGTGAGLVRYARGVFTVESFFNEAVQPDGIVRGQMRAIQADARGHLWVASKRRVARFDGKAWTTIADAAPGAPLLTSVWPDRQGTVWIGSERGLIEWRDGKTRTLTVRDGLPSDDIRAIYEGSANYGHGARQIWVGTARGLARIDPLPHIVTPEPGPLAAAPIHRLLEDRDGVLWVGSAGRLFSRTRDGVVSEHPVSDRAEAAHIAALAEDREGHVWFGVEGGRGGLHRLRRHHVSVLSHETGGLPCDNIGPLTQGPDGTIWIGSHCDEGGVFAIRDGKVEWHGGSGYMASLLADADGSVWAGDFGGVLFRVDRQANQLVPVPMGPSGGPAPGIPILALLRDRQGALWIGTNDGLFRDAGGQWQTFGPAEGLASDSVRTIVEDRDGSLWIGLADGLAHYARGRFTTYTTAHGLPRAQVRAIAPDGDGRVWIGTYGSGLCRFANEHATCLGTQGGLLETSVHRLIVAGEDLWMSGDGGIRKASRRDLEDAAEGRNAHLNVLLYDDADGMKSAEANGMGQPAGWKMRDGSLWFPTQVGIARVDPVAVQRDIAVPSPTIEQLTVDGVSYTTESYAEGQPITAAAGASDIEIRYTAPGFARPEQMQFRYRLAGRDDDWIDAGARRVAFYTNLPPGSYQFEVMARSSGGTWSDPVRSAALALPPRWYQRLPVRLAIGLLCVFAVVHLFRLRVRRLRERAQALETTVSERTEELWKEREGLNAANRELRVAKEQLQVAHTQLQSVLDQLRVGVIIVNPRHEVLFVSQATRALLATNDEEVIGQPLDRVLPISPEALAEVQGLVRDPRPRARLTVRLELRSGQAAWAELEVRLDPRDQRNSLVYLYDVTETYELKRVQQSEDQSDTNKALASLIGHSSAMRSVHAQIRTVAAADATVLIEGETGTGKEMVARAIHDMSRRKNRPFVAINCAGLTESLLASQLFGHRRGAFTGAVADHVGLFEAAQDGTLLLDEVGDMPMSVQTHLLRVLQEREILRLGESKPRRINVRVLVATHRSLEQAVAEGKFREDLLYRILVVRIGLPPLRARTEDIPLLATAFMEQFCTRHNKALDGFSRDAMEHLMSQRWPGNVRELRAAIEWAVIRAMGPMIRRTDLPTEVIHGDIPPPPGKMVDEKRRRLIETLTHAGGNRSVAARMLGVSRSTLYRQLAALEGQAPPASPTDDEVEEHGNSDD